MRTRVTLDPDTEALVRQFMREHGVSFERALNDVIRVGFEAHQQSGAFRTRTANLGVPSVDADRAAQLAAGLEDEELMSKMQPGTDPRL